MDCAWRKRLATTALALVILPAASPAGNGEGPLDILLIGNSLTYSNELPALLADLLAAAGVEVGRVEYSARPNYGLEDHWRDHRTRELLHTNEWDLVVLQQGPSATEGRPSLLEYSQKFTVEIRAAGAEPALYMVWPSAARRLDFAGVAESYRMAAEQVDGLLLPVGEAWLEAWRLDPDLELYGPDGFHPNRQATMLAALVMALTIAGDAVTDSAIDLVVERLGVEPEAAESLKVAARAAVPRSSSARQH